MKPRDFYRGIFPAGDLDKKDALTKGKYAGIAVEITSRKKQNGKPKVNRYTITDDLDMIDQLCESENFCLCSPLSYCGKERTADHARYCYAIAVDLDRIRMKDDVPVGLVDLMDAQVKNGIIPEPTYIVDSGTGVHLYYVLYEPVALFAGAAKKLQAYKRELTTKIWNKYVVNINDVKEIQQEGIYQGFRMPGTVTKNGQRAKAFLTGEKVSLDYMKSFLPEYKQAQMLTLEEAKRKFPEWYERRVEKKEPKAVWHVSRNLYDWWRRKIYDEATVGHRYYCLMTLSMYAMKCSMYDPKHNPNPVTREELENDCFALMERFEQLTVSDDNHFDEGDVQDALEAFDERWIRYPRRVIAYRSGIDIPANTSRHHQKQEWHLEDMRIKKRTMKRRGQPFKSPEGRPKGSGTKETAVLEWFAAHPDGKVADCAKELNISRTTIYKYKDAK